MKLDNLRELYAFTIVAEEGSFTRAAARLGVSQSALSQTVRKLERSVGIRLLNRTTRSVSPSEAGDRLLARVEPALHEISRGFAQLDSMRDHPSGTIRITADEYAIESVVWPGVERYLAAFPDVSVELTTDYGRTDLATGRFDAGVRRGKLVSKDMIAQRIGPDIQMTTVGAPTYLAQKKPLRSPHDLSLHSCINLRLPTHGEMFTWTFNKSGKDQRVTTDGRLVLSSILQVHTACLSGLGLAYLPSDFVEQDIKAGRLEAVLGGWSKTFEGYHLYYPNRQHHSPAMAAFIEIMRYNA